MRSRQVHRRPARLLLTTVLLMVRLRSRLPAPMHASRNSGWLGISAPGTGITHVIGGTFVQTSTGTLALRVAPGSNDALQVTGVAILGGTLQLNSQYGFQPKVTDQLTLVIAMGGISGKFASLLDTFSPVITPELVYGQDTVE